MRSPHVFPSAGLLQISSVQSKHPQCSADSLVSETLPLGADVGIGTEDTASEFEVELERDLREIVYVKVPMPPPNTRMHTKQIMGLLKPQMRRRPAVSDLRATVPPESLLPELLSSDDAVSLSWIAGGDPSGGMPLPISKFHAV